MNKTAGVALVVVVVALGLLLVLKDRSVSPETSGNPIRIGALISETGIAAQFGEMSRYGIELAVEEINKDGGVDGRPVMVVYADDATDPKTAAGLYQKLTNVDNVDGIIGSNFDFVTQPVFELASKGDVVVLSPSSPRIPGSFETNAKSFVMLTDFSKIIRTLETYFDRGSFNRVGIVRFESAFGEEISKTLTQMMVERGKPTIVEETYQQFGNNNFRPSILKLKTAGVDVVYLDMLGADLASFITQAEQLDYRPRTLTSSGGLLDGFALTDVDKKVFNGVVVINWDITTDAFARKFQEKYNILPTNSANRAYDAVYVIAQAAGKAESKAGIATLLERESFKTPNGTFAFDANHTAKTVLVRLQVAQDGALTDY